MGSAVTAAAMPMPSTNCHAAAFGPSQPAPPVRASSARATRLPSAIGTTIARPAVMAVSPRRCQAWRRSSSSPAMNTNSITAHQARPLRLCTTAGVNTAR
jgi:hypothetical protein